MTTSSIRAALYARVSSDQQAKDQTIASQVEALEARIRADGLGVERLAFLDDGCSGSHLIRPLSDSKTTPPPGHGRPPLRPLP